MVKAQIQVKLIQVQFISSLAQVLHGHNNKNFKLVIKKLMIDLVLV